MFYGKVHMGIDGTVKLLGFANGFAKGKICNTMDFTTFDVWRALVWK
jgi:hypothetical protein